MLMRLRFFLCNQLLTIQILAKVERLLPCVLRLLRENCAGSGALWLPLLTRQIQEYRHGCRCLTLALLLPLAWRFGVRKEQVKIVKVLLRGVGARIAYVPALDARLGHVEVQYRRIIEAQRRRVVVRVNKERRALAHNVAKLGSAALRALRQAAAIVLFAVVIALQRRAVRNFSAGSRWHQPFNANRNFKAVAFTFSKINLKKN